MSTRRARFALTFIAVTSLLAFPLPSFAASGPQVSVPYPAVVIQPGEVSDFNVTITTPSPERVALAVTQAPKGWTTTLRGSGFVIDAVEAQPTNPPTVTLEVQPPATVSEGTYQVVLTATSPSGTTTLPLQLRVSHTASGNVTLTSQYPSLKGAATASFSFGLTLTNNLPQKATFDLTSTAPAGWTVNVYPTSNTQASTADVSAGGTSDITASVSPPSNVTAGTYHIQVTASSGSASASAPLTVDITGTYSMTFGPPSGQPLNASVTAGGSGSMNLVVQNTGSAPLDSISLTSSPPSGWKVTFSPSSIAQLQPNASTNVTATITPASDAIAGDYDVSMSANSTNANQTIDVRTTVNTSPIGGLVGLAVIVIALGGLAIVFRRYGRR